MERDHSGKGGAGGRRVCERVSCPGATQPALRRDRRRGRSRPGPRQGAGGKIQDPAGFPVAEGHGGSAAERHPRPDPSGHARSHGSGGAEDGLPRFRGEAHGGDGGGLRPHDSRRRASAGWFCRSIIRHGWIRSFSRRSIDCAAESAAKSPAPISFAARITRLMAAERRCRLDFRRAPIRFRTWGCTGCTCWRRFSARFNMPISVTTRAAWEIPTWSSTNGGRWWSAGKGTGQMYLSWNVRPIQNEVIVHGTRGVMHVDRYLQTITVRKTYRGPRAVQRILGSGIEFAGHAVEGHGEYGAVRGRAAGFQSGNTRFGGEVPRGAAKGRGAARAPGGGTAGDRAARRGVAEGGCGSGLVTWRNPAPCRRRASW